DQQFVGILRAGQSADGAACKAESAGDSAQAEPVPHERVDGGVLFADPVGQASGPAGLGADGRKGGSDERSDPATG
ncbi:hypothetical protein, partial [Kitasatospora sp. NPDC127116]|uniref:hypothetical protein n=1 Tax=Kitasatospora sp. NPDC127116 TaxID=3345367 RepID=UPI00363AF06D